MHTTNLKSIAEVILAENVLPFVLRNSLLEYKQLLLGATGLDLELQEHQSDIVTENGIAIGLSWAADCLDDIWRTQTFIQGIHEAIGAKHASGKECVHILYAGIGPFATLMLPLLTIFSSDQLKVTLLEINSDSLKNVKELVSHFGFEGFVEDYICADATKLTLENPSSFDILLSETMQHALVREQQVIITSNLLNQMSEEAILIPQSIDLDLVFFRTTEKVENLVDVIGELMHVNSDFLRQTAPLESNWTYHRTINFSAHQMDLVPHFIVISTEIQVYGKHRICFNESGLTIPKILMGYEDSAGKSSIDLTYRLVPEPNFDFKLN